VTNDEQGEGNIDFRKRLHQRLSGDEGMYKAYLEFCAMKPQILFNSAFWVYEARAKPGKQNIPFILRPQQDYAIDRMKLAIDEGHNLLFDKSREEGATELIAKMFTAYFLLYSDMYFLVGSRVEDYVDKATGVKPDKNGLMRVYGNHKCIFHKLLYAVTTLPPYMQPNLRKSHLIVENLDNGSAIGGEATTFNFGAGDRAKAVLVDECARIEPDIAQYIIDNIQDTTPCAIYNSTHFKWGTGHPYAQLINSNKVEMVTLGWEDNPVKNFGLYTSPEVDQIIIKDIDYYRDICPDVFNDGIGHVTIDANKPFVYSDLQLAIAESSEEIQEQMNDISFVADGGEGNFNCMRSVWYDDQEARGRSRQDLAINILRIPQWSADQFFDGVNLVRVENTYVCEPNYTGTIKYEIEKRKPVNIRFQRGGPKHLKWWGPLPGARPRQDHNYIVSCDISRGTGASNSVATITDVNTSEVVGLYVNSFIDVTDFAELAVALCLWCGGGTKSAYLIWEANGPGDTFKNRVRKIGYHFVYYKVNERAKTRKRSGNKQYGWYSTTGVNGTKSDLLSELDAAVHESLVKVKRFPFLVIHDIETIREMREYIFLGDRIDVGLSSQITESSGARYAHGDRVIATALAMLALKEQPKASIKKAQKVRKNSLAGRILKRRRERQRDRAKAAVGKWMD
jgi:hypothetical protein